MQSHAYWVQITALYHRIYWDIGVISRTAYRAGYLIGAHAIDKISTLKGLSRANPPCPLGRSLFCGLFLRGILTKTTSIECREAESVFHSHFPMGSNLGRLTLRVRFDVSGLLGISAMGLSTNQLVSG